MNNHPGCSEDVLGMGTHERRSPGERVVPWVRGVAVKLKDRQGDEATI